MTLTRREVYREPIVDGRPVRDTARPTVLVNKAPSGMPTPCGLQRYVVLPSDEQLRLMLDSGTYSLGALPRGVRLPVKRLALAVSEQLV